MSIDDQKADEPSRRRRRRWPWFVAGGVLVVGGLYAADVALAWDDVNRNTVVAGVAVGGMDAEEASAAISGAAKTWDGGTVRVTANGQTFTADPAALGLAVDMESTLHDVSGTQWNPITRAKSLFRTREVAPVVTSSPGLTAWLESVASQVGSTATDAGVRFEGLTPVAVYPADGQALDVTTAADQIRSALPHLTSGEAIALSTRVDKGEGTRAEVDTAIAAVARPAVAAPVTISSGTTSAEIPPAAIAAALHFTPSGSTLAPTLDPAALAQAAPAAIAAFNVAAADATVRLVGDLPTVVPGVAGTTLEPQALATALTGVLTAPAPRAATVAPAVQQPAFTTEQAQALGITQQISSFTTRHPCCQARVTNIHTIARILDGYIVKPGQTFDLNKIVGKRDTARGFVEAPMISEGEFRTSVGGGISQFATTLYNATFFGGLKDVTHSPHSYYINRYPPGREATVSWTKPDLIFQNDTPYGVLIDTSYTGTSVTVSLYSTKQYDIEAIVGPRTKVTSAPVKYITRTDDCNPASGAPGFTITNTRVYTQNGAEVKRDSFTWTYKPEPKMICGAPPQ